MQSDGLTVKVLAGRFLVVAGEIRNKPTLLFSHLGQVQNILEKFMNVKQLFLEAEVENFGDGMNVKIPELAESGIFFTVSYDEISWGLAPEDNWPAVEEAALALGIDPDDFWHVVTPELSKLLP